MQREGVIIMLWMFRFIGIVLLVYVLYVAVRRTFSTHYPAIIVRYSTSPTRLEYEVDTYQGKKICFEQRIWLPPGSILFESMIMDYFVFKKCLIPYNIKRNKPFTHPTRLAECLVYAFCLIILSR